jgi:hypothetical protein
MSKHHTISTEGSGTSSLPPEVSVGKDTAFLSDAAFARRSANAVFRNQQQP